MKGPLLVVGSLNMDLVVRAPRLPRLGETVLGGEFRTFPGGKGANQAVACARLGAPVTMIGRVGQDAFGASLLQTLAQDGVDLTYIRQDGGAATGVALITVVESGDNAIVVASGANGRVSAEDVRAAEAVFREAAALVLQLECPLEAVTEAVHLARHYGLPIVLNPAPARPLPDDLLQAVDYLIPNESELALLSGREQRAQAIEALLARGVRHLVITLGEEGALLATEAEQRHFAAYAVQAVDTTAAGDAFVGAFAVALAEGQPLAEAIRWGNAAGALAVTRPGAQPSLPRRAELVEFMEKHQPQS